MARVANDRVTPEARTRRAAQLCFAAVGGLCLLVLLSWASGKWQLGTFGSQNIPMAPSTAFSFLMLAAAAWLWQSRPVSVASIRFARTVVLAVLAVSLLVWGPYLFGIQFPSFSLVRTTETVGPIPVGRMSPLTALAFLLASLGLLVQLSAGGGRKVLRQTAAIFLVLLLFLSTGVTLSYVLQVPLFSSGTVIPMAALTAVGFTLLGLGLLMRTGADTWPLGLFLRPVSETPPSRRFALGLVAMALLLVASTGATGYAHLRYKQNEARRVAAETLSVVADLKVDQIAEWYLERRALAVTVSMTPLQAELQQFMTNPADTEARGRMLRWLWAIQQEGSDSLAALVDSQGIVRLAVPSSTTTLDAHMLRDCRKALQDRTLVVQDLHRHASDQRTHLSIIVPLMGDRSDLVLALEMDAERSLIPIVESWPTPSPTAETLFVRREGHEVVYMNELRHQKGTALTLRVQTDQMPDLPAVRAALGEAGAFEGNDYRQVPVVAALRAVPGTPWFLVAKIDRAEIYAPFRREVSTTVLVLGVLALTAILVSSVLWYRRSLISAGRELVLQRRSLESERNFGALFEQAAVGVAQMDARTGRFLRVNRRYRDLLGFDEEEMLRATWKDITHPEDVTASLDNLKRLVEGETRELTLETRFIRKDGDACWVSVTLSPLWTPGDEPLQYVAVVQDISGRKRVEEQVLQLIEELEQRVVERTAQLEFANSELDAFSYSVSHDLRAPLRGINGWSGALLEDYGDTLDDRAREYLGRVRSETQRMGSIIDDLLKLSRVTLQEMQPAQLDLSALAVSITRELQERQPSRVVEFIIQPELHVHGDAGLLHAALNNLFENAWKFTSKQSAPLIEFGRMDHAGVPVFFVRDNGVGFDINAAQKLFSPFERLHKTSEFPGTGVGLATVQRIIHRHGGRIWAEAAVDRGATFYFTLETGNEPEGHPAGRREGDRESSTQGSHRRRLGE